MDTKQTEDRAIETLLQKGILIKIGKKKYHLHQPTIGMMDEVAALQIKMKIDENKLSQDALTEGKVIVSQNAKLVAEIVGVYMAGPYPGYAVPVWKYLSKCLWKAKIKRMAAIVYNAVTPSELLNLSLMIAKLSNHRDFTNSTRLLTAVRITAPKADQVEQPALTARGEQGAQS